MLTSSSETKFSFFRSLFSDPTNRTPTSCWIFFHFWHPCTRVQPHAAEDEGSGLSSPMSRALVESADTRVTTRNRASSRTPLARRPPKRHAEWTSRQRKHPKVTPRNRHINKSELRTMVADQAYVASRAPSGGYALGSRRVPSRHLSIQTRLARYRGVKRLTWQKRTLTSYRMLKPSFIFDTQNNGSYHLVYFRHAAARCPYFPTYSLATLSSHDQNCHTLSSS